MRSGVIRHNGKTVNEDVSTHLDAPWHGSIVEEAGVMIGVFVTGPETSRWSCPIPSGTDIRFHDETYSVVSTQSLTGEIDLDAFPALRRNATLCLVGSILLRPEEKSKW